MKSVIKRTIVQGTPYEVWSDYIMRATFAKNEISCDVKAIKTSGYLSNDLSIRKAIAVTFGHSKFSR